MTDIEFITIGEACRLVGGEAKPIHAATYYRGVAAGRYPAPVHPSPNIARICKQKLLGALERLIDEEAAA